MNQLKLGSISSTSVSPLRDINSVQDAFNIMKNSSISSVIITDDLHKPIGIFTEHDAIKLIANGQKSTLMLSEVMSKKVFCMHKDSYIHDAYVLMEQKNYRHIIVIDDDEKYLGVVSEGDFLRHMGFEDISKKKKIEDAMSDSILTIDSDISLTQVATLMSKRKCDYAIIIKDNIPEGIINERDIAQESFNKNVSQVSATSLIKQNELQLVHKSTSLQEASDLMKKHGVHQLVVVDDNNALIGLITRHDILKAMHGSYFDYLLQTIENKTANELALIKYKEELEKVVNYDQLTKLPNRLYFKNYLKDSLAQAIKDNKLLAVLVLDLDRFKDINDSYGHTIGDEILKIISTRLLKKVKDSDLVVRLGGDEFAIILEDLTSESEVTEVIDTILKSISKICKLPNSIELHIESSIGVVMAPKDTDNVEEILQYADSALYQAKNDGRGGFSFYTNEMTIKTMNKVSCENALRKAVQNSEFELYFQPQVHIKTGKIVSCEALIRWNNPTLGLVFPDTFIPIAEETGLINSIGEWVIYEACRVGKEWMDKGYNLTIAVNVSPNQVKYQNLPEIITNALKTTGYSANKLEIEITESSLMQREEDVVEMLHSLRAKGIRLAIDDFGTGYSSLSYLKRFPIDILKIDKSFIDDVPYEKDDMAIVVAIIEMGKALGFEVLAEGTQNKEQLDFLEEKGCHLYQGFIKSKAVKAIEFEKLLDEQI